MLRAIVLHGDPSTNYVSPTAFGLKRFKSLEGVSCTITDFFSPKSVQKKATHKQVNQTLICDFMKMCSHFDTTFADDWTLSKCVFTLTPPLLLTGQWWW